MKSIPTLIFFLISLFSFGQQPILESKVLTDSIIQTVFTDATKKELGIRFPIFKAYEYTDKLGKHYLILTENGNEKEVKETKNDTIKAFNILSESNKLTIQWTINDFKLNRNEISEETSIWFWSKYIELNDIDGDGIIDPIIIYGTSGSNGTGDGRIKILTYYKNTKYAIRHQNGELDFQRNTKVDKAFYELPAKIQARVQEVMAKIYEDNNAIFPAGWQGAMKNKKLAFDENNK